MGIYKHKSFDQDVKTILDYIQSFGNGTIVTINTVKEKTGLNEVYACNVLKEIKSLPQIETKKSEENKKATFFKMKDNAPAEVKMHKKYRNLTEDQVGYIQSILATKSIGSNFDMLMSIANVLAGMGAAKDYVSNYTYTLADLLILKHTQIRLYVNLLKDIRLVDFQKDSVKLILDKDQPISIGKEIKEKEEPVEELAIKETVPVETVTEPPVSESTTEVSSEPVVTPVDAATSQNDESVLVKNMENFTGIIGQFQDFMKNMISQVTGNNKSEIQTLNCLLSEQDKENAALKNQISNLEIVVDKYKNQLTDGNTALKKALEEITNLKNSLIAKTEENRQNKRFFQAQKTVNTNIFEYMQERFQILLADINNTISDYTRIPAWQMTPADGARVQKQVIDAITSTMNDLIDKNRYKTNDID